MYLCGYNDFADESSCSALGQDMFQSVFAEDPQSRAAWDKYRHGILKFGGGHEDMLKMLEDFLGREPNLDAFVESVSLGWRPPVTE